jgi:Flp pilus assembly protein TadD
VRLLQDKNASISLCLCLALQLSTWQSMQAADSIPAPRFFLGDQPLIKASVNGGPVEITTRGPADTIRMANIMRSSVLRTKHKSSFKTDGKTFTIVDETAKKSWIIKSSLEAPKKRNPEAPVILAEMFPKNASILFGLANYYEGKKNWTKAHDAYVQACKLRDPEDNPFRHSSSNTDSDKANEDSDIDPGTDAYYQLMMGHYATAIKELSKAIAEHPNWAINYRNRALAYRKINKPDLAQADEKKLAELAKEKRPRFRSFEGKLPENRQASLHVMGGQYEMALEDADVALKKTSKEPTVWLAKAQAELKLGRYQDAARDFQECLKMADNANREAIKVLATTASTLAKQGPAPYGDLSVLKDRSTRKYFRRDKVKKFVVMTAGDIAADHKGDYRVYEALAEADKQLSKWKERSNQLNIMARIEPKSSALLFSQMEAAQALADWPLAEKLSSRYLEMVANNETSRLGIDEITYAYMIRGLARQAQKNYSGAVADQSVVLKLAPGDAQTLQDRADCYDKLNKPDLARQDRSLLAKPAAAD